MDRKSLQITLVQKFKIRRKINIREKDKGIRKSPRSSKSGGGDHTLTACQKAHSWYTKAELPKANYSTQKKAGRL